MGKTTVSRQNDKFLINGKLTYQEIPDSKPDVHGLLMNQRFIQGIFDHKSNRQQFARFGQDTFDPDKHTDALIAALPEWYKFGLRAFTVGLQGGGPCFTTDATKLDMNPFGPDGKTFDPEFADRLDRLIRAADDIGMVVIVSYFYWAHSQKLQNDAARAEAVKTASRFLRDGGYANVMIEIANEYDVSGYKTSPNIFSPAGVVELTKIAQEESGGLMVGTSGQGGSINKDICEASDYILIHGNSCPRQRYYHLIMKAREWQPTKPIVCNEDSQALGQLDVAYKTQTSWGYYNNMTKQEPPADWGITKGEDTFFAYRMAEGLGINIPELPEEEQYYLQGLEPEMTANGQRWIRIASLYPETINYVDFYRNGELIYTNYDEPFSLYFKHNWQQGAWKIQPDDKEWKAVIHLRDGRVITKVVSV